MEDIPAAAWSAAVGLVGLVLGFVAKRGPDRADIAVKLNDSALAIVNELQEEVGRHSQRIEGLEREVRDCEARYSLLASEHAELKRRLD